MKSEKLMTEVHRFYRFVNQVILPNEPKSFDKWGYFHHRLCVAACLPFSVTAAPRNHLKSTVFSRYRVLHRLVDPEVPNDKVEVLLVSESSRLAKKHLGWIKDQLGRNEYLRSRYGDLTSDIKWNEEEIRLSNGNVAFALGYGSSIRGEHPTDIIVDDLESTKNMGTEESLSKLKEWFYRVLMGCMNPDTTIQVIGTIIASDCLLTELLESKGWVANNWTAIKKDGTALWPERWPLERLLKVKERIGTHAFNAEYMGKPVGLDDEIIRSDWVARHELIDLENVKFKKFYIGVDPAFTEERWGDDSAICVLGESSSGMIYTKLLARYKVTSPELIRKIISVYDWANSMCETVCGIEEVQSQKHLRQAIMEVHPTMNVIGIRPDGDKVRRLISVSRYFERKMVSIHDDRTVNELLEFPIGKKDMVDAMVYALKLYEMDHPVIVDGQSEDIDDWKGLRQEVIDSMIERWHNGLLLRRPPQKYLDRYAEAEGIAEEIW